jgi:hypothetical protein
MGDGMGCSSLGFRGGGTPSVMTPIVQGEALYESKNGSRRLKRDHNVSRKLARCDIGK